MQISVIIPMYNGSNSITNCLEKLAAQDFIGEYEIIVVDDASTDGSAEKVKKLIEGFSNKDIFRVIECKKNGRAGGARNIGVEQSKGEYVVFVDQDDYPDEKMLSALWALTKSGKIDCASCNMEDKGGVSYHRVFLGIKETLEKNDRIALFNGHGYSMAILIRKSVIEKYHLHFPTNVMFEDCLYPIGIFSCIESFANTEDELYYREIDDNSQTAFFTQKKLADRIASTKWYIENFEDNEKVQEFSKEMKRHAFYYIYLSCVWWMITDPNLYDEKMLQEIIKDAHALYQDWDDVLKNEKRFKMLRLRILKYIYFHPKSCKKVSDLILFAKKVKNILKGKKY